MSWPEVPVETLASSEPYSLIGGPFGSKLTSRDYVEEGIPVIRGANMGSGRYLDFENFVFVTETKVREDLMSNLAYPGDIVFTQRGTLGQVTLIPENSPYERFVVSQSQMKLAVDESKADKRFLYYYFSSPIGVARILNQTSTSGVPHINLSTLRGFTVPRPGVPQQKAIADILSAYDDLIENNRRRMALLEESARLLYREWFVHLRFPGHEHVPIIDGVPKGWERKKVGDVLTLQRGFDLSVSNRNRGSVPIYASTGITGFHDKAIVPGPGVITGRSGSLGTVKYSHTDFWPLNTALWVKDFKGNSPVYIFHLLSVMHLEQYNGGAAVPTLNRNDVHRIELVDPPKLLKDEFAKSALVISSQVFKLEQMNDSLVNARDLLLPRLMNGEIAV